jgi:hypothetical protein
LSAAPGTGKTTSLAALVDHRNKNSQGHIITVEDPIEFVHEHKGCIVTQREVGVDTDSWEAALKNSLRQAPDVILMGEIRDRETMDYAVAFAETGHLCLATLHANSTNQAIDRIINFFPEERRHQLLMDLSLNLRALVSQRLLPKKDGKGRVAAIEIMLNSPLISDLIFKGEVHEIKEVMKRRANSACRPSTRRSSISTKPGGLPTRTRCAMPTRSTICVCRSSCTAKSRRIATSTRASVTSKSSDPDPAMCSPFFIFFAPEGDRPACARPGRLFITSLLGALRCGETALFRSDFDN